SRESQPVRREYRFLPPTILESAGARPACAREPSFRAGSRNPQPGPLAKNQTTATGKTKTSARFMGPLPCCHTQGLTLPEEGIFAKDTAHSAFVTLGRRSCRLRRSTRAFHCIAAPGERARPHLRQKADARTHAGP